MAGRRIPYELVTVFGGSGFVGRYVVRALAKRGYRVRVAVRRPELAGFLRTSGNVGQIQAMLTNVRDEASVARAVEGAEAVVNLVGILQEGGRQRFDSVHSRGAGHIGKAAASFGITRVAHVSALGADLESGSLYAQTKAEGEQALREAVPTAAIFRPSIVFGPEDRFFNRFAGMARVSPVLPLIGGGQTKFQPVFVSDLAEAIALSIHARAAQGQVIEAGGPEIRTFRQLMELMLHVISRKRLLVSIPFGVADRMASVFGFLPGAPLTRDQVAQLHHDNVVSQEAIDEGRTLEGMGLNPVGLETVLPTYLQRFRRTGEFANTDTPPLHP